MVRLNEARSPGWQAPGASTGRVLCAGCLAALLAIAGCAPRSNQEPQPPRLDIKREIEDLLADPGNPLGIADTTGIAALKPRLVKFYADRHHHPIWSNGKRPNSRAQTLLLAIPQAEALGLDPARFEQQHLERLAAQAERSSAPAQRLRERTLARFDVLASIATWRLACEIREGWVPAAALDPDWTKVRPTLDPTKDLKRVLTSDPSRTFAECEPHSEGYRRLRDMLARYRMIAHEGGWSPIPAGPPLQLGARGPRVAALLRRLRVTGDLAGAFRDTVYDSRVVQAVGDFQTRLGIPRSGTLGDVTRAALNVPVERRIHQMQLNLERWRWLPDTLGKDHLEVNIPAYRLELVRNDTTVRAMRVVVGKSASPTPVFSSRVSYFEINPTWTLPPSVVTKEIVPALKRHHDYLQVNHMHVISIASALRDTVDPAKVPWKDAASDSFLYLVVQDAGPENPLGHIKLMCPNEYDVYLHDTPQRSRFSVAVRNYSHGCVRVEHAVELADSLVAWTSGDTSRVDSLVTQGAWMRVRLKRAIPVHFLYWTAWVDPSGKMYFRDDVYGLDQRMDDTLRRGDASSFALNPGVSLSPFWMAAQAKLHAAATGVPAASAAAHRR